MTLPASPPSTDPLAALVGIPFASRGRTREGLDCWGLHRLAMQLGAGVEVPSYSDDYADAAEAAACAWLIERGTREEWLPVRAGEECRLDAVLMRSGRLPSHLGTVLVPGRMLHTYSAGAVRVDYYRRGLFKERIVGFFRHQSLA